MIQLLIFVVYLQVLPEEFGIVCTHPMFGPESGKDGWGKLPFVYDRVRIANANQARKCEQFLSIFETEVSKYSNICCMIIKYKKLGHT